MASQTSPSSPSGFLSLPLEIRLMIYEYVMLHHKSSDNVEIRSFRYQKSQGLSRTCVHDHSHRLPGICTANRQTHSEMEPLLHFRPIRLVLVDDLLFTAFADTSALRDLVARSPWVRENTVEVRLCFVLDVWNLDGPDGADHDWSLRKKKDFFSRIHTANQNFGWSLFASRFIPSKRAHQIQNNLASIAIFLSTFPKLGNIELFFDHQDIIKTWTHFWEDLQALRATGARVSFNLLERKSQLTTLYHLVEKHGGQMLGEVRSGEARVLDEEYVKWLSGWRTPWTSDRMRSRNIRLMSPEHYGGLMVPVVMKNRIPGIHVQQEEW